MYEKGYEKGYEKAWGVDDADDNVLIQCECV